MQNKSYGGFITPSNLGREYFSKEKKTSGQQMSGHPISFAATTSHKQMPTTDEYELLRLNLARHAIALAAKDGGFQNLWVPLYVCPSVFDALKKAGISVIRYHLDENLEPLPDSIPKEDGIVIIHYFGTMGQDFQTRMQEKYQNVIFDNTQCFFDLPMVKEKVYTVYSPRKFFPVSDGGYLITKRFRQSVKLQKDFSGKRTAYLLIAAEEGTNAVYDDFMRAEEELNASIPMEMSDLTRATLSCIDYAFIKAKRYDNFTYLSKALADINELAVRDGNPFVYPLLLSDDDMRKKLIDNKIYISQWWKWVLKEDPNPIEAKLSRYLLPLPIDQRLKQEDLDYMISVIRS